MVRPVVNFRYKYYVLCSHELKLLNYLNIGFQRDNHFGFLTFLCFMLRIRVPYPFQWGAPTFDAGEAFAMMAASFVALVEVSIPSPCAFEL